MGQVDIYSMSEKYIEKSFTEKFEWGKLDCVLWVAKYVEEVTGIDHIGDHLGTYSSKYEACKKLLELGFDGVPDLIDNYLSPVLDVRLCKRGDIVFCSKKNALGICNGKNSFFLSEEGVVAMSTMACDKAWKIK